MSIVILNWEKASETIECLRSLERLNNSTCSIVVVDNGSNDGSVCLIRQSYPTVTILKNSHNLGYAAGNNVGLRYALTIGSKYIFVLNNDARVAADTLFHLVSAAEQFPDAAFLGPKIYHLDSPTQIQSAGATLDYLWRSHQRGLDQTDIGQFDTLADVDYVIGAAVLVRADALKRIGLLNPDFFLYREDVDWCLRAKKLGYRTLFVPAAKVWHRSHHIRENELPRITYYLTRNSLMLIKKHQGGILRFWAIVLRHLLTALTWTIRPKWRHKQTERNALLKGLIDFLQGKVGQGYA